MNSSLLSLLVLAGIAIFLILRLRSVLGTRDGFEKPRCGPCRSGPGPRRDFEVIEGGPDDDITDHVENDSDAAKALAAMKMAEPGFNVREFLQGARGAYEMILMAFERAMSTRCAISLRPMCLKPSRPSSISAPIRVCASRRSSSVSGSLRCRTRPSIAARTRPRVTVRFVGELTSVVRNSDDEIIEGDASEIKRQRDVWTFARTMGADNPNWLLVATDV
jgi:hypothetical protein